MQIPYFYWWEINCQDMDRTEKIKRYIERISEDWQRQESSSVFMEVIKNLTGELTSPIESKNF